MSISGVFASKSKILPVAALPLAKSGANDEDWPILIAAKTMTENTLNEKKNSVVWHLQHQKSSWLNIVYKWNLQENFLIFSVAMCNQPGAKAENCSIYKVRNCLRNGKGESIDGCFTQGRPLKKKYVLKPYSKCLSNTGLWQIQSKTGLCFAVSGIQLVWVGSNCSLRVRHLCKSLPRYLNCSFLCHNKTFLSWYEWVLHSVWGLTEWFSKSYVNHVLRCTQIPDFN